MMRLLMTALLVCAAPAVAQFELDLSGPTDTKKPDEKKPDAKKAKSEPKPAAAPAKPEAVELDLSTTSDVKGVLLLPPIVRVTQSQGGFSGFDTKKTFDKFDYSSHKRFVTALQKELSGKVTSAEATQALITKEGLTVALARTPSGLAKLAKAGNANAVVLLELSKTGSIVAAVFDGEGVAKGEPLTAGNGNGLSQKAADDLAVPLGKAIVELSKAKAPEPVAKAELVVASCDQGCPSGKVCDKASNLCVEEEINDSPPLELKSEAASGWTPDPDKTRVAVAVGPGGIVRDLSLTGDEAGSLARLRNGAVVGVGVYAQLQPLQFIPSLAGKRFSDLEVEVHYRRAFVRANGVDGSVQGQSCSMTDDDLQLRGTYRFKVAEGTYAPQLGVGAGWSQERTVFDACTLPLVSATYRGIDLQARYKQPLFRNVLALDLAVGPRILQGDSGTTTRLSLAGEAWLELKPVSVLFVRGGARGSRLSAELPGLTLAETRFFFALEAGAFF